MRRLAIVRYVAIAAIAMAALPSCGPSTAPTPDPQIETTYGLGLPRDGDVLFIPDSDYPNWPLRADQMGYADVSGGRMKEWVRRISAISLQSQADGYRYWGRLPGTVYDSMTMDLMIGELQRLGLDTERVPHTIPRDWSPTFWEASYSVGGRALGLPSAFPAGQTAGTPTEGITAEAVWVGVGA